MLNPKRICILTPGPIGSNPRSLKQALALVEHGYDVTVIAVRLSGKIDLDDESQFTWKQVNIDLRPRAKWYAFRSVQVMLEWLAWRLRSRSLMRLVSSPFTLPVAVAALKEKANLYIAHYPASLPAAATAARLYGGQLAYDAEDFHLGDFAEAPEFERYRFGVRAIEGGYLSRCSFVTAASPLIARAVADAYSCELPLSVLNCFPLSQGPERPPRGDATRAGPSVYWYSQTIGPHRGLEHAILALSMCKSRPHLYLRGLVSPGYQNEIQVLTRGLGISERIHFLAPIASQGLERAAASFDLGLCGEPGHTLNNNIALSNKLFGFILAGVPPLMSDTPAQVEFAVEAGIADLVYPRVDASYLANLIDSLLMDRQRLNELRERIWTLGRERYNWNIEQRQLLELVTRCVNPPLPHD